MKVIYEVLPDACMVQILCHLIGPSYLREGCNLLVVDKKINYLVHCVVTQDILYHFGIPFNLQQHHHRNVTMIRQFSSLHQGTTTPKSLLSLRSYYIHRSPKIVLIGGVFDNRKCDILHPWSGKFQKQCSLAIKRNDDFEVVSCFHNHIMVISGSDDSSLGVIELFSLPLNNWYLLSPLQRPLIAMSICSCPVSKSVSSMRSSNGHLINNIYLIGGVDRRDNRRSTTVYQFELVDDSHLSEPDGLTDTINKNISIAQCLEKMISTVDQDEILSHTTATTMNMIGLLNQYGKWIVKEEMALLLGRSHHSSAWLKGNLWTAGGMTLGGAFATKNVEIFDSALQSSRPGPPMLTSRLQFKLVVIKDVLYAVGGDMNGVAHAAVGSIESFDEDTQSWKFVTSFPAPSRRVRCAAVSHGDRIYIFGGTDGPTNHTSWDYYNVVKQYWGSEIKRKLLESASNPYILEQIFQDLTSLEISTLIATDFNRVPGRLQGIKCAKAIVMEDFI